MPNQTPPLSRDEMSFEEQAQEFFRLWIEEMQRRREAEKFLSSVQWRIFKPLGPEALDPRVQQRILELKRDYQAMVLEEEAQEYFRIWSLEVQRRRAAEKFFKSIQWRIHKQPEPSDPWVQQRILELIQGYQATSD
jgi:hypothetical protein